jgi:fructose-bisphosphate aldolase class II
MPLVTLRQVLAEADEGGYGVGAFNVSNLEQVQAVLEAAEATRSPVVLQVTRKARAHAGDGFLRHLILAAAETYPGVRFVAHLDHGNSPAACSSAIDLGFTSVMMDGSLREDGRTPADFEYNVRVTRQVAEEAHARGASVEGELGVLGGAEDGHGAGGDPQARLTSPDQAAEFVERTGVDALAVAVGTSHGAYKFTRPPGDDLLRLDLVEEIRRRAPRTPLVLHGASSIPGDLVAVINRHGGALREARGVPFEHIRRAISLGVRKVNVDSDGRLAFTAAVRKHLAEHPESFDPRALLQAARDALRAEVVRHIEAFRQPSLPRTPRDGAGDRRA